MPMACPLCKMCKDRRWARKFVSFLPHYSSPPANNQMIPKLQVESTLPYLIAISIPIHHKVVSNPFEASSFFQSPWHPLSACTAVCALYGFVLQILETCSWIISFHPQKTNGKNHNIFGFIPPSLPLTCAPAKYTYQFESPHFFNPKSWL